METLHIMPALTEVGKSTAIKTQFDFTDVNTIRSMRMNIISFENQVIKRIAVSVKILKDLAQSMNANNFLICIDLLKSTRSQTNYLIEEYDSLENSSLKRSISKYLEAYSKLDEQVDNFILEYFIDLSSKQDPEMHKFILNKLKGSEELTNRYKALKESFEIRNCSRKGIPIEELFTD